MCVQGPSAPLLDVGRMGGQADGQTGRRWRRRVGSLSQEIIMEEAVSATEKGGAGRGHARAGRQAEF